MRLSLETSWWRSLGLPAAVAAIVLTACGGTAGTVDETTEAEEEPAEQTEQAALPGEGETVKLWDGQWQSLQINNAIAAFVLEHGYGYEVETVVLGAPVMEQALPQGDIDAALELWRVNRSEWYEKVTNDGTVVDVGPVFERATQGYYVPRFVIEGDPDRDLEPMAPDLKSVSDLPQYTDVFADPEDPGQGAVVNCPPDWECNAINEAKFAAYGLLDDYNLKNPGSPGALDAEMAGAAERGDPVVGYYWEPTALMGRFDFVQLEEPEWTEACEEANAAAREAGQPKEAPEEAGCAFQTHTVNIGVHADLEDRAPEAVAFLEQMEVGTDPLNQAGAFMDDQDAEPADAAVWFFDNFDHWGQWLEGDALERVEQALDEAGDV